MTRDELERAKQRLDQGLELPRDTVKALVAEALKHFPPRKHPDGCGWWRGGGCTCEPVAESIDLALKNALTEPAP